jgi:site-specific recombinase XerD
MAAAVEADLVRKNPCIGVTIPVDETALIKDVLSTDEVLKLIETHYDFESKELRRAFIFTLYTGIRYCDLVELTYKDVDYPNKSLHFNQSKTKHSSPHSHVDIPLNDFTLGLIGDAPEGNLKQRIFPLPSHESCNKSLKRWCKRAGISKHITWHCGRHSFATNILESGASVKTVADLLGHSGLKYTERYARAVDERKKQAVNSLPVPDIEPKRKF